MADIERSEADLLNNIFPDNQSPGSITAQDMRDLIVSAKSVLPLGWEFMFDSDYSSGSPLTLSDGVPVQMTINSNPGEELRYPPDFPGIWDGTLNRLFTPVVNGFGILRLSFFGVYTGGTAPHFHVELDVGSDPRTPVGTGGASNIIYTDHPGFAKASGDPQAFNFILPLFIGADFAANGGYFVLEADGDDIDIYNITLTAARIFSPNPTSAFGV